VKGGSSDQSVDIQAILESIAAKLVSNMGPNETLISILAAILTYGGVTMFKAWFSNQKEIRLAEIEALKTSNIVKAQTAALDTIAIVSGVDRSRVQLIEKAREIVPIISSLQSEADRSREALVKHLTKDDARLNGVQVTAEAGQTLTSSTRLEAQDSRRDGLYKIRKVDTTSITGFRVHLSDKSKKELIGDVAEVMTTLEDRQVIKDAEWSKIPVFLQINAKERRGKIVEATIVRARLYEPETDGIWTE
jgi:hypothetical protein